ncbi:MAG: hypothetical protein HY398_02075 [Candidatus Doudnabacteria bacterium]|nr:hypothetical protein [Candidatus Doudnabacteria bacterium]
MTNDKDQPITSKYLLEFTQKYILPEVRTIVKEESNSAKNEILTSNDKLSVKLDKILKEQAAHSQSYQRLEKRINVLEEVVKILAEKAGISIDLSKI